MTRPSPGLRGGVGDQSPSGDESEESEDNEESFECQECEREFGTESAMRRHLNHCIRGRDVGGVLDD